MKKTSKLSRLFKHAWLSHTQPNAEWDKMLNLLMDKGEVTKVTEFHIIFNDKYKVWIENHPYASGSINKCCFDEMTKDNLDLTLPNDYHCTKKTKIRLEDFYYNHQLKATVDGSDIIAKHRLQIENESTPTNQQ